MSHRYLGPDFDIHGGGQDLIFPHHQNEIAQSCCAHPGSDYARFWMHNGMVLSEGEKMSKSLGNFYMVQDLLKDFPGEVLRLVLLQTHYRQPLNFSYDKCRQAVQSLTRLYGALLQGEDGETPKQDPDAIDTTQPYFAPLLQDLNTPKALAAVFDLVGQLNKTKDITAKRAIAAQIRAGGEIMGLLQHDPESWLKGAGGTAMSQATDTPPLSEGEITNLIAARQAAKAQKDFAKADSLRQQLGDHGIVVEDQPGGKTRWRKVSSA